MVYTPGVSTDGRDEPRFPYDHGDWKGVLRDDLHFITLEKELNGAPATASPQ